MEIFLRSVLGFIILLIVTRIMGQKQVGQFTFFDYIAGITIGNMAAVIAIDSDVPVSTGVIGLAVWTILVILLGILDLKWPWFRRQVDGQPVIIIKKGRILKQALRQVRLDIDDLTMLLRTKDVFSIAEVDYAILESNGELSVLKKQSYQTPTKQDLHIPPTAMINIPTGIIADGLIIHHTLKELGISEKWVYEQLEQQNLSLEDVLYGEIQEDRTLVFKLIN